MICHFCVLACSRGILANCADFFGFTCCQSRKDLIDWTRTYEVPKQFSTLAAELKESKAHSVKIPMPYSSTWDPATDSKQGWGKGRGWHHGYVSSDDESYQGQGGKV